MTNIREVVGSEAARGLEYRYDLNIPAIEQKALQPTVPAIAVQNVATFIDRYPLCPIKETENLGWMSELSFEKITRSYLDKLASMTIQGVAIPSRSTTPTTPPDPIILANRALCQRLQMVAQNKMHETGKNVLTEDEAFDLLRQGYQGKLPPEPNIQYHRHNALEEICQAAPPAVQRVFGHMLELFPFIPIKMTERIHMGLLHELSFEEIVRRHYEKIADALNSTVDVFELSTIVKNHAERYTSLLHAVDRIHELMIGPLAEPQVFALSTTLPNLILAKRLQQAR